MCLGAGCIPLYVHGSWGHLSTLSDEYCAELLTAEHPGVELGEDLCSWIYLWLVDIHGLEGGMQNNRISWINVHVISGGEAHRAVRE